MFSSSSYRRLGLVWRELAELSFLEGVRPPGTTRLILNIPAMASLVDGDARPLSLLCQAGKNIHLIADILTGVRIHTLRSTWAIPHTSDLLPGLMLT